MLSPPVFSLLMGLMMVKPGLVRWGVNNVKLSSQCSTFIHLEDSAAHTHQVPDLVRLVSSYVPRFETMLEILSVSDLGCSKNVPKIVT